MCKDRKSWPSVDLSPGLVNPSTAKAKARTFVLRSLELPAGPEAAVMTSTAVRLTTGALCCKTDAILIRANDDVNFVAGQLWLLFSVEDLAVALVSLWDFLSHMTDTKAKRFGEGRSPSPCEF